MQQAENAKTGEKLEYLSSPEMVNLWTDRYDQVQGSSLFFQTVHHAFAKHYPLALSPDVLMYLVANEVATAVKLNPEEYRSLFTTSPEKRLIRVQDDALRMGKPSQWDKALSQFYPAMKGCVPSDIMEKVLPPFSTHTETSQIASLMTFLDMASPYFEYRVLTCCGIPKIRLLGKPEDYQMLYDACLALSVIFQKDLGDYFKHLLPVVDKIAKQTAGEPIDNAFWSSIYKHLSGSGTDDMTGWLTAFVNYISADDHIRAKDMECYNWKKHFGNESFFGTGIPLAYIPAHVNRTPFVWEYFYSDYQMEFLSGVLSVENVEGYLAPRLGFGIKHK